MFVVHNAEVEEVLPEGEEHLNDRTDELLETWADLQRTGGINKEETMMDFMSVDSDVITDGALTLEEIVAEVSAVEEKASDVGDNEQMDAEVEKSVVTRQEAQSAFNIVRRFLEKNFNDPAILKLSDALDEALYQDRKTNEKQTTLTNFFPVV